MRIWAASAEVVASAMARAVDTPAIRADYHDAIPLNRYGGEDELAYAVFYLCSERAGYITGQMLAVDGGFDAAGIGLRTLRKEGSNG
jgi:NAD(P)-dependent dehydrogenase (short-subunit alcohol dehydrogenase family)